jgi:LuxR family transcriptional regulator, maltose regulon positive regulatory protein
MAVAEVPFDLVGVKLAAPSARPGTVAKADAIGRLCASTLPFATVVAPAGYGKTTLLAKWAEADWIPDALLIRGVARALLGATDRATDDLTAAVEKGIAIGAVDVVYVARAQLALLAAKQGAWGEAGQRARAAQALVEEAGLGDYSSSAIAHVATARVALHEARPEDARTALARAHRLRPLLDHGLPWLTIQVGLELTRAHLALADPGAARTILTETEHVLELRPDLGLLVEDARELHEHVARPPGRAGRGR